MQTKRTALSTMDNAWAPRARDAWALVQQMLADMTYTVSEDAETQSEFLEGLRMIARVSSLCAQLSVEADAEQPRFLDMCTPTRMVGGPNPNGNYYLAMIRGDRRYRVTGHRGTTAYLGVQVLAGTGLTPRRMTAHLSDSDLRTEGGRFALVFATERPTPAELDGAQWIPVPADTSSIVVREYIGDPAAERPASLSIEALDPAPPAPPDDTELAEQFTAMAWTIAKLTTLHRTIRPELLTRPNTLLTAAAAALGDADTTPDNLYMIGTFRLAAGQTLLLEFVPPPTRYWNVALENIWHECLEPTRRHSSVTDHGVVADADGLVRIAISDRDAALGHWLDTGGRRRGFVVLRWLDNPAPPEVTVSVHDGAGP